MKKVPEDWKTASVIFQKGKEADMRNYRPHFKPWQVGAPNNPGSYFQAHKR